MNTADALRQAADRMNARVQSPRTSPEDLRHFEQVQHLANAIADQLDADTLDPFLHGVKTLAHIEFLLQWDHAPIATWDFSELNRMIALKLDAASLPIAHMALLALDDAPATVVMIADVIVEACDS